MIPGMASGAGFSIGQRAGFERYYPAFQVAGSKGMTAMIKKDFEELLNAIGGHLLDAAGPLADPIQGNVSGAVSLNKIVKDIENKIKDAGKKTPAKLHQTVRDAAKEPPKQLPKNTHRSVYRSTKLKGMQGAKQLALQTFYKSKGKTAKILGITTKLVKNSYVTTIDYRL